MYLAGIGDYHIISGYPNPLQGALKLSLVVLKVIQHTKPFKSRPRPRLPITPYILQAIHTFLDTSAFVDCMLWAACLMGFYGFLEVQSLQPHLCPSLLQTNTFLNRHSCGQLRKSHSAGCKNKVLKDRPIWGRGYYVPWKDQQCPLPGSTNPWILPRASRQQATVQSDASGEGLPASPTCSEHYTYFPTYCTHITLFIVMQATICQVPSIWGVELFITGIITSKLPLGATPHKSNFALPTINPNRTGQS